MSQPVKESFFVLVADDSEDDRILLQVALRRAARLKLVGEVGTGKDAIAYLKGHAPYSDRKKFPLPDLMLLDLKMPLQDGFEVLEWLGKQSFPSLTVVVLTDSMNAEHIKRALDLGADLFQVKPTVNHDREVMILALEDYLLNATKASLRHLPTSAASHWR